MDALIILCAVLLDLLAGDPRWLPHPVRIIGTSIAWSEKRLRTIARSPAAEKAAGVLLVVLIVLPVWLLAYGLLAAAFRISFTLGYAVSVLMASTTLAARGLADAARSVRSCLDAGNIEAARRELAMIVGRDTAHLTEQDIARAAVETVAENTSDGVVAPLCYLALGGPALAMAYKAINTLDSMVGYKNDRYIHFGWAAARLDDAANFIPARITAVLICLSSSIFRRLKPATTKAFNLQSAFANPWRIMLRDGRSHPSPNSGFPEAAMAGALGIRLGGPSTYNGILSKKPSIGSGLNSPDKKDIEKSVLFMYCASLFAALAAAALNG